MATESDEYQLEIKDAATLRNGPVANFQGAYTPGNAYRTGDVTEFNSAMYLAIADDPVAAPSPNPALWRLLGGGGPAVGTYRQIVVDLNSVSGDDDNEVVFTGSNSDGDSEYTFTLANNVSDFRVQLISGGGGGGGSNDFQVSGGGGGSSGIFFGMQPTGTAGNIYNLTVGNGGTGGAPGVNGVSGSVSSIMGPGFNAAIGGAFGGRRGATGVGSPASDGGSGANGGGGGVTNVLMMGGANGGSGSLNGGGAGVRFDFNTGDFESGGLNGFNPGSLATGSIGGDGRMGLGGKGGSVWWLDSTTFIVSGGNGGASMSPITDADTPTADTSRYGLGATTDVAATTPNLPGGGGGGGNGVFPNGAAGSPGRIIIKYVF